MDLIFYSRNFSILQSNILLANIKFKENIKYVTIDKNKVKLISFCRLLLNNFYF